VDLANSQAIKKSGDQVILAVGMIIASHEGWLSGQTVFFSLIFGRESKLVLLFFLQVYSFLPKLFYEVCGVHELSESCAAFLNARFRERKIGYLSPINSAWPEEVVQFPDALVATPCRSPDKQRFGIDCKPGADVKFESEGEEEGDEEGGEEEDEEEDEGYEKEKDEEGAKDAEAVGENQVMALDWGGKKSEQEQKVFSLGNGEANSRRIRAARRFGLCDCQEATSVYTAEYPRTRRPLGANKSKEGRAASGSWSRCSTGTRPSTWSSYLTRPRFRFVSFF